MTLYILSTIATIEACLLVVCSIYLWKFSKIIFKMEDEIEKSLDILDEKYRVISSVLEIPIFFDSPEIKKVVEEIKSSRDTILNVARTLANVEETNDEG